jgi:hypothetical protein
MKKLVKLITLTIILFSYTSCLNSNHDKQKELEVKEKELELKEKEINIKAAKINKPKISTNDAIQLAEKQFTSYLPKILKAHDAIIDLQESYTGDFTGDGIEDIAIYFSLAARDGGNSIVGQGLTLYQNNGNEVKVIAAYEPVYLFAFDRISNGKIYVEKLEYAEDDASCCPSIKTQHAITISGSNAY